MGGRGWGGGGIVSVDTKGEGVGGSIPVVYRDPFEILVQNTRFSCIKNKNSHNFALKINCIIVDRCSGNYQIIYFWTPRGRGG